MPPLVLDPAVFRDAAIDPETRAHNAALIAAARAAPDRWSFSPQEQRRFRREGKSPFVLQRQLAHARAVGAEAGGRRVSLRLLMPQTRPARGVYLHIHGGGWMLGAADLQDERLAETAERTGLACLSVEYRLTPEHPYPAAPDDCETAALWLVREGFEHLGLGEARRAIIGGESAGAHLSAVTLLRLRDRHGLAPFAAANLVCGAFDLALTPSMRAFTEPLILARRDVEAFVAAYLRDGGDVADPDVSPLHAELSGLPPVLFTCGTRDGLLDDTLFMAARWLAAGNTAELQLWPGGAHAFQALPIGLAAASNRAMDMWMAARLDEE